MMHDDDAQSRPGGQEEGSEWERGQKIKIVIPGGEAGGNPFDGVGGCYGNTPSQIVFYIKGLMIRSKPATKEYSVNYDRIFKKRKRKK